MTAKVFVDGEHGTTGLQIIERLKAREDITLLTLPFEERRSVEARRARLREADVSILCLPDDAARESVEMADGRTRFIDASTAHRTAEDWVFGFKELTPGQAASIAKADKVSNPGCYSTGAIALLRPLTQKGLLPNDALVTISAVSGYTGGGKGLIAQMEGDGEDAIDAPHFLYATGLAHKHVPEITRHSRLKRRPIFTPSVGRFPQGMIVQVPLHADQVDGATRAVVHECLAKHYRTGGHVRVVPMDESDALPRIAADMLAGEDRMDLHVFGADGETGGQLNLVAVLDNLGKGASGACVQALDLMIGAAEA